MSPKVRDAIVDLEREGWKFVRTSKGHWRGKHPKAPGKVLILSGTASDWRADANARSVARRLVS